MVPNKKMNLQELKKLIFDQGEKNKSNKDRLFKLAKVAQDMKTIEKMRDELGFKSARMYLDKLDNLSLEDAIKNRDFEIFKKRIENGSDISKIKTDDLIDMKYDDTFIELLIKKGRYVNIANLARKKYKPETIKLAIENSANANETYENMSGLFFAIKNNQKSIVELLLSFDININKKFAHGITALSFAVLGDANIDIIKVLLNNGADINTQVFNGFTPLISASDGNNIEIVKLLLEYGADINKQTGSKGTALILAAVKNNVEIVKILLEHGADVNIVEITGATALDIAEANNNQKIVNLLLEYGSKESQDDWLPLTQAFIDKDIKKIDSLLKKGNGINQPDGNATALMHAAVMGDSEMIKLLLEYGADINLKSQLGFTALISAAGSGQYDTVKLLLSYDANKNVKGYAGLTALDTAQIQNHSDIVQLLQSNKTDKQKINNPFGLKARLTKRAEHDFKEVILNKVLELGEEGAKSYMENLNTPEAREKEINSLERDSTAFIERGLKRKSLTNEEMSTHLLVKSVGEYDGSFIHEELKGVSFQTIKTNIGYFLDTPLMRVIDPFTQEAFPLGHDWEQEIGKTFDNNAPLFFLAYAEHIFLKFDDANSMKSKSLYKLNKNNYDLTKELIHYDYSNQVMYDEFVSLVENDYDNSYLEEYLVRYAQYIDVDKFYINGNTPLMIASARGNTESTKLLLQWGVNDPNIQNKEGYTALMLAADRGHYEICNDLIKNDADATIKNYRGQNAMHFAINNMHPDIIELLENNDVEIESLEQLKVYAFEKEEAEEIVSIISDKLNDRNKIIYFLVYALNCSHSYELDLDYYINNNPTFLVSFKPGRDQQFNKDVVKVYKDMHEKYLNPLNIKDVSKNNIRNKIYDLLMHNNMLGKYEDCQFEESKISNSVIEILRINKGDYKAELKIYDNHMMIDIISKKTGDIDTFKYDKNKEHDKKFENKDRGTIIITEKKILEYSNNGGKRQSDYDKVQKVDGSHNPKALSSLLNKFGMLMSFMMDNG